jgi:hypothetical protein
MCIFRGWDDIKMETAQDMDRWWAVVHAVLNLKIPQNAGNSLTSWRPVGFWIWTLLHGVSLLVYCRFFVDGRIILKMEMDRDMDRWWAFVNAVMNLWVAKMWGIWLAEDPLAFQEGMCSMVSVYCRSFVDGMDMAQGRDRCGLFWMWQWTFGFHKRRGISWLVEWRCFVQLVIKPYCLLVCCRSFKTGRQRTFVTKLKYNGYGLTGCTVCLTWNVMQKNKICSLSVVPNCTAEYGLGITEHKNRIRSYKYRKKKQSQYLFDVCVSVHFGNISFYSIPTGCIICFISFLKNFKLYMFRLLFAPIVRTTTAVYSHRGFCYGCGVFYSID